MVAKITEPIEIERAVYYNENKVSEGVATLIDSNGFLKDTDKLNLRDKLQRFQRLHALNDAKYKTLHISLNFAPSEQLGEDTLKAIAAEYMQRIGFGDQPYLVYEHNDAGHPHIHIVVTAIREDGSRIDFHKIGENESETARKAIEEKYGLVRAEDHKERNKHALRPLNVQKLQYGKSETLRGITNVLDEVLPVYKYSSLPELNAILSLYNVRADPGEPGGRINRSKGLLYRLVDDKGRHVGKPVKASAIYSKPTLAYLEKRFAENGKKQPKDIRRIKNKIDWVLITPPTALQAFVAALRDEQIYTVVRQNDAGLVYGLTFVDVQQKSVMNGSDIGKEYTAKQILGKLGIALQTPAKGLAAQPGGAQIQVMPGQVTTSDKEDFVPGETKSGTLLGDLMDPEKTFEKTPWQLLVDQKKKKKNPPKNN